MRVGFQIVRVTLTREHQLCRFSRLRHRGSDHKHPKRDFSHHNGFSPSRVTFAWVVSRVEPLGLLSTRLSGPLVKARLRANLSRGMRDNQRGAADKKRRSRGLPFQSGRGCPSPFPLIRYRCGTKGTVGKKCPPIGRTSTRYRLTATLPSRLRMRTGDEGKGEPGRIGINNSIPRAAQPGRGMATASRMDR